MDRRQKIMRLIIVTLEEFQNIRYSCKGAVTVLDPNLIALEFTVTTPDVHGDFSVRGAADQPLHLMAQFDGNSVLNIHPKVCRQIDDDLKAVASKINRIL